jgi:hypothetical protein
VKRLVGEIAALVARGAQPCAAEHAQATQLGCGQRGVITVQIRSTRESPDTIDRTKLASAYPRSRAFTGRPKAAEKSLT